jgi:iron-sulfur cluster insertion protein
MSAVAEQVHSQSDEMPPPLIFTDSAAEKVRDLVNEEGNADLKLRVFVQGGGCSGFQYGFTFDEETNEDDTVMEKNGVQLLIDAMSYQYLVGAEIDYKEDLEGAQFVIKNPNASTSCGCGSLLGLTPGKCTARRCIRWSLNAPPPHYQQTLRARRVRQQGLAGCNRAVFGQRGLHVGGWRRGRQPLQRRVQPARIEQVATGALGRLALQKGLAQQALQQGWIDASRGGPPAGGIVGVAQMALAPQVHQCVAGTTVETAHRPGAGQQGQVADAAQVEHGHVHSRRGKERGMQRRNQRRPLASRSHVAAAQVADDVDAAQFGQQRTVHQLQRVARSIELLRPVAHGLAMGADRPNPVCTELALLQQCVDRAGIDPDQRVGGKCSLMQLIVAAAVQLQELHAQRVGECSLVVGKHAYRGTAGRGRIEVGQHTIHAVKRGAGHQPDVQTHRGTKPLVGTTRCSGRDPALLGQGAVPDQSFGKLKLRLGAV